MKRIVIYNLVLSLLLVLMGCKSYEETIIKFKPYKESDFTTKFLKIYEEDSILHPILDSIIVKTQECPMYSELKQRIAFSFGVVKEEQHQTEEYRKYPLVGVAVVYDPDRDTYQSVSGVFFYRHYDFYIYGPLDLFFKDTGKTVPVSCIKPDKYQFELHNRGDVDMYWWYQYIDGKFVIRRYGHCNQINIEPFGYRQGRL